MEGAGFGVYFAAGFIVLVEGAFDVVVFVGCDSVMGQNLGYGQPLFDVGDLHGEKSLKIFYLANLITNIAFLLIQNKRYRFENFNTLAFSMVKAYFCTVS